eukprot:g2298.t1
METDHSVNDEVKIFLNYEPKEKLGYPDLEAYKNSGVVADMIISIGGDGTVIYAAKQFPNKMPPLLCFAMGSLGYMTNFKFEDHKTVLDKLFRQSSVPPYPMTKRMRIAAHVRKADHRHLSGKAPRRIKKSGNEPICIDSYWVVMNEVLLFRGLSSMAMMDAFVDGNHLTTIQADGIIVATPTGSTAYSLSAGGSVVMPTIPAMLFTPVCPHSLSFRPLLLHAETQLRIEIPIDARSTPSISFDGKDTFQLERGDAVEISVADSPLLLFDASNGFDFINGLKTKLNWNVRENQKPFNKSSTPSSTPSPPISPIIDKTASKLTDKKMADDVGDRRKKKRRLDDAVEDTAA